ncbi:acyloxyacyl hydrolase [Persicobacter psychrovividus]|uniref:Lipid A 3-O-deacylase PagL n=1 Tax=Persicobacter psychrovividus TaxID=387638 RepID=A0ABM7VLJ7_9BACT|nr:hypothetical protein PEPS_40500 [Persicobacter psychrovividus]
MKKNDNLTGTLIVLILLWLPFSPPHLFAQNTNNSFLKIKSQSGKVLLTNDFLKGDNETSSPIDYYHAYALEYGRQTAGNKAWERAYLMPKYGLGFYTAAFFYDQENEDQRLAANELGHPMAVYAFFEGPFKRWHRFSLQYRMAFGLTYNWNAYDPDDNHFQVAIGSKKTVYIEAGTFVDYMVSPRWNLQAGFSATHFSNGATTTPNYGVNLFAPYLSVQYNFNDNIAPKFNERVREPFEKKDEVNIGYAMGVKQISNPQNTPNTPFPDLNFVTANINTNYMRRISQKSKIGVGIDLNFDESSHAQVREDEQGIPEKEKNKLIYKLSAGSYVGYELVVNKVSLVMNVGAYLLREHYEGMKPVMYQRLGVKYQATDHLYGGIYVRAYKFGIADFIEWQVGYRFIKS